MNIVSKRNIKNLFKKYKIRASKGLGQNFLIDKKAVKKFIESAYLKPNDVILEIGPGLGVLTQELAEKVKKVMAVEKDPKMTRILLNDELRIIKTKNVEIIQGDILKILNSKFKIDNSYKVVANLPFYLTAPVIRKFLESNHQPREIILIVQKEVGQRICAQPPDMNLLAVAVQIYAKPKIVSYISRQSFWPKPKVDSAIIRIAPLIKAHKKLKINVNLFFKIVRAGFSQPRKQLLNNLSKTLELNKEKTKSWLLKNKIQPSQRAESLEVRDWINLTKSFTL